MNPPNDDGRTRFSRAELTQTIARITGHNGRTEPLPGLFLTRADYVAAPTRSVVHPSFCVIAQGAKEILLGAATYRYDPFHYLLATIELPTVSRLIEASPDVPYLSLRLDLDPVLVASVMLDAEMPSPHRDTASVRAVDVSVLDTELLDAAVRLVRLCDAPPAEARVLMPLVAREIVFRLLAGNQGARLRQIAVMGGASDRIARAIERLRRDFNKPLRIETLARDLGMSASGFHEHFRAVTALSPLQFQKQIRLTEARRLLLSENENAASVAYRVGYEDTSHFSREYKRHFGEPPLRDVERLRQATAT